MLNIQIDSELQAWIDPLSDEEFAMLEASILLDGCRDPLVVWGGYLLDGHNRYTICSKHGIEFQTFEKSGLKTKLDVKIWMIENQIGKRNTTDFGRTALALKLKPLIEERSKLRMLAGKSDPVLNSTQGTGKTRDAIAKMAGVGSDTVRKVEKIIEKATPEVIQQVRSGEISINAAAKTIDPPKEKSTATQEIPPQPCEAEPIDAADAGDLSDETIVVDKESYEEMIADYERVLSENTHMGEVFDADDRIKASMDAVKNALQEAAKQKAIADNAERTLASKSGEFIARAQQVTYWQNQAKKEKKRADIAEKELARLSS